MLNSNAPYIPTSYTVLEFAKFFGLHLWFTYQFVNATNVRPFRKIANARCDSPLYQFFEQNEELSRFEISRAMNEAEQIIALELGYWPGSRYIQNEEISLTDKPNVSNCGYQFYNRCNLPYLLQTRFENVQAVGTETFELIASDIPITRVRSVNDNIVYDKFTLETPYTLPSYIDPCEIYITYGLTQRTSADGFVLPYTDWQIRPLDVSVDTVTNNLTIWGDSVLLVHPSKLLTPFPDKLTADDASVYIGTIDIYRRYYDPLQAGSLQWLDNCDATYQMACMSMYNNKWGMFRPFALNEDGEVEDIESTCQRLSEAPDKIRVNYVSGCHSNLCGVNPMCRDAVFYLTAAYLQCLPCGCACNNNENRLKMYAEPPHKDNQVLLKVEDLNGCPFGASLGALKAWELVKRIKQDKVVLI